MVEAGILIYSCFYHFIRFKKEFRLQDSLADLSLAGKFHKKKFRLRNSRAERVLP